MKSKMTTSVVLAIGACIGGSSCASQPDRGTAQNTYSDGEGSKGLDVVVGDRWLQSTLQMEEVLTKREGDRLHVQFNLSNKSSRNLPIEWTVVWFDATGFELKTSRHWTPIVVGGKGFQAITCVAPTEAAAAFRLGLREPNTVH